jgi:hypothetical protein
LPKNLSQISGQQLQQRKQEYEYSSIAESRDVPTKLLREEFVKRMEERHISTFGVPRKLLREEYVICMAQQRECISVAALKDVTSKSRLKEFVTHMVQWRNYAAAVGVPIKLKRGDFV